MRVWVSFNPKLYKHDTRRDLARAFNTHGQKFVIWMIIPVKNNSNDEF